VLTTQGHFAEARLRYFESLKIHERLGPNTTEVAATLEQFAGLLYKTKSDDEAMALESRAKSIRAELRYVVNAGENYRK
jgi:hypothetical protein